MKGCQALLSSVRCQSWPKKQKKSPNTKLDTLSNKPPILAKSPCAYLPLSITENQSFYLELVQTPCHEQSWRNQESGNPTQKLIYTGTFTVYNVEIATSGDHDQAYFTILLDTTTKNGKNFASKAAPQYILLCLIQL